MGKKILIVDDSSTVRQQLKFTLSTAGFNVVEGQDGVDGLAVLAANADVALIISDVNMPNMNGLEFLKNVKAKGVTVPVIMLTTEGAPELIAQAKQLGAKGWMVKPFNPEQMVAAATKLAG